MEDELEIELVQNPLLIMFSFFCSFIIIDVKHYYSYCLGGGCLHYVYLILIWLKIIGQTSPSSSSSAFVPLIS